MTEDTIHRYITGQEVTDLYGLTDVELLNCLREGKLTAYKKDSLLPVRKAKWLGDQGHFIMVRIENGFEYLKKDENWKIKDEVESFGKKHGFLVNMRKQREIQEFTIRIFLYFSEKALYGPLDMKAKISKVFNEQDLR
jgi:hypothetical protein